MIYRSGPVTQVDATQLMLKGMKRNLERAAEVAVSQRSVLRPSDAAGGWTRIGRLQDLVRDQSIFQTNTRTAQSVLATAEGVLTEGTNLLTEARELAVQLASGTYNDDDRAQAATRIDAIRSSLIGLANTEFAGRSIFAGTAYDTPAYNQAGVYLGTLAEGSIVVGEGQSVRGSIAGNAVFDDALDAMSDLAAALRSGSADNVAQQLDAIDDARSNVVRERSRVGFDMLDAEDASDLATSLELTFQGSLNDHVAADPVEAFTRLSELSQAYEVALQVSAQVSSITLFDFLR